MSVLKQQTFISLERNDIMYCPKCNAILDNDAKFCENCGAMLSSPDNVNNDFDEKTVSAVNSNTGGSTNNDASGSAAQGGYVPNQNTGFYGGCNPNQNPNFNGGYAPNQNPNFNGGYNPNQNPNFNGGYAPNQNPNFNGGYNPNQNPNFNGGYQPNPNYGAPGQYNIPAEEDKTSAGWCILSFIVPLAGLVIFLTNKDKKPKHAKACGIAALIGFILGTIGSIVNAILGNVIFSLSDYADYDYMDYVRIMINSLFFV